MNLLTGRKYSVHYVSPFLHFLQSELSHRYCWLPVSTIYTLSLVLYQLYASPIICDTYIPHTYKTHIMAYIYSLHELQYCEPMVKLICVALWLVIVVMKAVLEANKVT